MALLLIIFAIGGDKMPYTIDDFKSGAYVNHPVYGYGQILAVDVEKGKVAAPMDRKTESKLRKNVRNK